MNWFIVAKRISYNKKPHLMSNGLMYSFIMLLSVFQINE